MTIEIIDGCFGKTFKVDNRGLETYAPVEIRNIINTLIDKLPEPELQEDLIEELVYILGGEHEPDEDSCDQCGHWGGITKLEI